MPARSSMKESASTSAPHHRPVRRPPRAGSPAARARCRGAGPAVARAGPGRRPARPTRPGSAARAAGVDKTASAPQPWTGPGPRADRQPGAAPSARRPGRRPRARHEPCSATAGRSPAWWCRRHPRWSATENPAYPLVAEEPSGGRENGVVDPGVAGPSGVAAKGSGRHNDTDGNVFRWPTTAPRRSCSTTWPSLGSRPTVEEIRALMATMAADCPLDADTLHKKASVGDRSRRLRGGRLPRAARRLPRRRERDIDGLRRTRHRQPAHECAAVPEEPAAPRPISSAGTPRSATSSCCRR